MTSLENPYPSVETGWKGRRALGLSVKALYYLGIWPVENEPKNLLYYWRYLLPRVQLVRAIYSMIFQIINTYIVWGEPESMAEHLLQFCLYMFLLIRSGSLYLQQNTIKTMVDSIENLNSPLRINNDQLQKTARETEQFSHRLMFFLWKYTHGVLAMFVIGLNVMGLTKRVIPFRIWLPYNYSSTPIFEITLVTIQTLLIVDLIMVLFPIFFYLDYNINIIGQYKLLQYNIENIRKEVEGSQDESEEISGVVTLENIEDTESAVECTVVKLKGSEDDDYKNQNMIEDEGIFSIERNFVEQCDYIQEVETVLDELEGNVVEVIVHNSGSEGREGASVYPGGLVGVSGRQDTRLKNVDDIVECDVSSEVEGRGGRRWRNVVRQLDGGQELSRILACQQNRMMDERLKDCVKDHQLILSLTRDLQRVFKVSLHLEVFGAVLAGLFALYVTTLAAESDFKVIIVSTIIFSFYCELFLVCWMGNNLTEQSEQLREAVYGCEWYGASESFKRSIRIMISRTNRPEVLKAGGMTLSVRTFRFMGRTGYYLHNVIVKMMHGVKINEKRG